MITRCDDATFVVTAEPYLNDVPRVRPIGVMILFLGNARNLGHKCKGFLEIGKLKPLVERTIDFQPRFSHPPTLDGTKDG
jgi:hypothetical protein